MQEDQEIHIKSICLEVIAERKQQDLKFGEQNHCPKTWLMILGEEVGEANKAVLEAGTFEKGRLVSLDPEKLKLGKGCYREELIQIAAVAVAMVECLDKNKWNQN